MTQPPDQLPPQQSRRAQRNYFPRIAGLALGGLCVGASLYDTPQAATWVWLLLLFNALLWPHLAYYLTRHVASPRDAETRNLLLDSLLGGFWVVAMQGNLLPAALVITMMMLNNMLVGGLRLLGQGALAHIAGALLGLLIFGWEFRPESNLLTQVFSLVFLVIYPTLIGRVAFQYAKQLKQRVEILELSENDPLSGLHNRPFFEQKLAAELESYQRQQHAATLIVVDLVPFAQINDHFGRSAGDAAIRQLGAVFAKQVRASDISARLGEERFALLLPLAGESAAQELAKRLQASFAAAINGDPRLKGATLKFGIAAAQPHMQSQQQWQQQARQAMAPAAGSN